MPTFLPSLTHLGMEANLKMACFICNKSCKDQKMLKDHMDLHMIVRFNRSKIRSDPPPFTIDLFPDPLALRLALPSGPPLSTELTLASGIYRALARPPKHRDYIEDQEENEVSTALSLSWPSN
ncbi:putative transcription factor C2H2 family [Helianthus anomalus]